MEDNISIDEKAALESQQSAWASEDVRNFVADVGTVLAKYPELGKVNFGLFYQNGRLGFIDLDAFAKSITAKTEENGEEKTLEEIIEENK